MKKINLVFMVMFLFTTLFAQDSTKIKKRNNEFGIDVSGFIRQFFFVNTSQFGGDYYFQPVYYLTYRRHFKKSNLRFGIGGDYSREKIEASLPTDINKYERYEYAITARIGYEFFNDLSNRWQVFYGLDFRPIINYSKNDAPYWNGGYANGRETFSVTYGLAPLLGFRYKILKRLSLSTEGSFTVNYQNSWDRKYYIPVDPQTPPMPDEKSKTDGKIFTGFSTPIAVIITFDI